MIEIFINNERLDMGDSVVTFKKAQQLNGIQNQYSFSNNFELPQTSKNRRLLNISYLPNSKAKSMTVGYNADIVLNGCIFLKNQSLKVQKETKKGIPVFILYTDSYLITQLKALPVSSINTGILYAKTLSSFTGHNSPNSTIARTGYISAQSVSGFVVAEEVPILYNLVGFVKKIALQFGYTFFGDFFEDAELAKYYFNPNVGIYENDGVARKPALDPNINCQTFLLNVLTAFNAFADISDVDKSINISLWKNIEGIKSEFKDYSDKFVDFEEYLFTGGLAKKNIIEYANSLPYYNSFFENNKSVVDQANYLKSTFGAGNMALFSDQETVVARVNLEANDPGVFRLYKFENGIVNRTIYSNSTAQTRGVYQVYSPNMLEIWQNFHQAYCRNISLPTIANLTFAYDAIFINSIKMQEVFYIKQLSTYWLPLELNFSTKKDFVKIKALMIEKIKVDAPIIYDKSVSVNFGETVTVPDASGFLYAASNISPLSSIKVIDYNRTKNKIYITGTDNVEVEIVSFPTLIDVRDQFKIRFEHVEVPNAKSSSDFQFQLISEEGGESRVGKITVRHNGYVNYKSEFLPVSPGTEYVYGKDDIADFTIWFNQSAKAINIKNIPNTLAPAQGSFEDEAAAVNAFKVFTLTKSQANIKATFRMLHAKYSCSNRGGSATARTAVTFEIWKNGAYLNTIHSGGVIDRFKNSAGFAEESNILKTLNFSGNAGDTFSIFGRIHGSKDTAISNKMDGHIFFTDINWSFECSEQAL